MTQFFILFAVATVISAVGFRKFVYFISIGYGFAITGIGAALLILFRIQLNVLTVLLCAMLIVYGLRLGLYLLIREIKSASYQAPNYLGEVLIWTGVFVSGVTVFSGVWQWGAAIFGWVCIVYIMFGGARRLELRQNKNYGDDPEYQAYVKKTPILIPFIPLYSVAKYKWLVG